MYEKPGTNNWKTTTKKAELTVEEKVSERGFPCIRVTVEYDYDMLTIIRSMADGPTRISCDMLIEDVHNVKQYGCNLISFYQKNIKIFPVSGRDMFAYSFIHVVNPNLIHHIVFANEDEVYPTKGHDKSLVRAMTPVSGNIYKTSPDNPNKTTCIHYIEADLGGNIPNIVTQKVLNGETYGLLALKK